MSEKRYDVICSGGPFDGEIWSMRPGRTQIEVWRPVLCGGAFGKELIGRYLVGSDHICAYWMPTAGQS